MRLAKYVFAAISAALLSISAAEAATITKTFDFTATGFTSVFGNTPTPLVDPVTGSFTITLDPTQTYTNEASGLTLNNLTVAAPSPLLFNYDPGLDLLLIGGAADGILDVHTGVTDIGLAVLNFLSAPTFGGFTYALAGGNDAYISTNVATTPIPAALPLFMSALAGMGLVGYRRRKNAAR